MKVQQTASLRIIFFVVVIDLIGFGIILPLLPLYAKSYGAAPFVIGLLWISYSVTQFLFNPILGAISDRVGRRPIILMSLVGSVIFYTLFGWAPSLFWLFVARFAAGVFAANISTAMAFIADITTKENRAKGMGLIGAAVGTGFIIGPAVGGFLSQYSYSLPGYGAAILSLIALLLAISKLPESLNANNIEHPQKKSLHSILKPMAQAMNTQEVARPIFVYFLVVFAFANMQVTFPLYTHELFGFDVVQNGYVFAFVGILAVIFQGGLIGKLSKNFGDGPLAIFGTGLSMFGLMLIPFAKSIPVLVFFMTILGVGTGLNTPTLTSLVSISVDEAHQGSVLGVSRSFSTFARIIGPLWGGWSYGALGMRWPYWSAGVILFVAILVGLPLWRIKPAYQKEVAMVADS
ncbi:MAG: MFS transporter [bacterium]